MRNDSKFTGDTPKVEEIKAYLDKELFKEIKVIDMSNTNKSEYLKHSIIAIGFTSWHLFRAASGLKHELFRHFRENLTVRVNGTK